VRRRLPFNQALQCFEAAARHQSFTRAAHELALTQGAVSRQVPDSRLDAAIWAGTPQQLQQWAGTRATPLLDEDVLPVCSPRLLAAAGADGGAGVDPEVLAHWPLLQQATRPEAWRQWFDAQGVDAPRAMAGPRYELFSMQAAAIAGLGVALMPTLLVQDELASGALVVACPRPLKAQRAYYWVQPDGPERAALGVFRAWLLEECSHAGDMARQHSGRGELPPVDGCPSSGA